MTEHTFPHLSAVLDAGQLPTDDDSTEILIEAVVEIGIGVDIDRRASLIEHHILPAMPPADTDCLALSLAVDLLRSPELVFRVLDALGPVAAADAWWRIDCDLHPYPIFVGPRSGGQRPGVRWQCCNCGTFHHNDDRAVVIMGRPGWSDDLEDPITYCADCIRHAADAMTSEV